MTWEGFSVAWTAQAERDLARLAPQVAEHVERVIERHAIEGTGDVQPLQDRPGEYRLRVGHWRAMFTYDLIDRRLVVFRVLPRGRAYAR